MKQPVNKKSKNRVRISVPNVEEKGTYTKKSKSKNAVSKKQRKKCRSLNSLDQESVASASVTSTSESNFSIQSSEDSDTCSNTSGISDLSNVTEYSYTEYDSVPKRMKHKDIADTYFNKIGKQFKDLDEGITFFVNLFL